MRYASIRNMDISNGDGIGVALFTQGCPYHCLNCFNKETWDYEAGKEFTEEDKVKILNLVNRNYITRFSVLGGEPLISRNTEDLVDLLKRIKEERKDIKVWLYTGSTYDRVKDEFASVLALVDVLIDGPYIDSKRDLTLQYRGSSNQRLIDMQKTLESNNIVLY